MQTLHKLPQSLWDSMWISLAMYWRPWFLGVLRTLLSDRISELWRECFDEYFPLMAEYSKSLTLSILWGYVSLYCFPIYCRRKLFWWHLCKALICEYNRMSLGVVLFISSAKQYYLILLWVPTLFGLGLVDMYAALDLGYISWIEL